MVAGKWLDVRERLDQIRRTHALDAADFVAPGDDRVSKQITDRLQEAVDNGEGSLRSALGLGVDQIRILTDSLTATGDTYVDADTTVNDGMERRQP